jgi:hypothetical protein
VISNVISKLARATHVVHYFYMTGKKKEFDMERFAELVLGEFGELRRLNERLEDRMEQMNDRLDTHGHRSLEIEYRQKSIEKGQEKILDELMPLTRAFDADSQTLRNHEKRIIRLERECIKS